MLASVKGTHIVNYQSELKSSVDKRDVTFEFETKAAFENLSIGLAPYEKISLLSLNGKNLDFTFAARKNKVHLENLTVSSGDILKLQFSDLRWQSPAEEIISAPYLGKQGFAIVYRGEKAQAEAVRLQEYFRFWTLQQENGKVFEAALFADLPENPSAYSLIVLFEEGDSGISMTDNIIKISGKGNNLFAMSEEYLKALDSKYIYLGAFGEQMPVRFWDYAST